MMPGKGATLSVLKLVIFLQALHIGRRRLDIRPARACHCRHPHIRILLRYGIALAQVLPAFGGDAGDFEVGIGLGERGVGLDEFLVQLGRFDFRQFLALDDVRADVGVPLLQVAADARIDRRLLKGGDVSRQIQLELRRRAPGMNDADRGHLAVPGVRRQLRAGPGTVENHEDRRDGGHNGQH